MKKTIMIIGGGLLQIPIIKTAKRMGLQTIVTDYNPDAVGMNYADIPIVMSTRDIEGSVRVAKKQNELTPINGVLTVGTDASMTVAAVANALNLPGIKFEDAEAATNKIKMRTRFKENGVPSPKFFPVWSLSDAKAACSELGFPVVIKPSDNMGARGVMFIDNKNRIAEGFKNAKSVSPSGELIIEEYMEGHELSIDAVIFNDEITFTGIADRIIEDLPYFIEKGHTMPSHMKKSVIEEAKYVMTQGIYALGIKHGFAKGDIKVTKDGVKIGELAARLSGGFMSSYTYPLSTGVDLMQAAIEISLGQEPGNIEPVKNEVSIERAIITEPGIVKSIKGIDEAKKIPGIIEIFINVAPGDRVSKPKSNVDKAGHIIAVAKTLKEAEAAVKRCKEIVKIEIAMENDISLEMIRSYAKEKLNKICLVCTDCNGEKCPTGVPGMGASGSGDSFKRNIQALKEYKINTRVIHNVIEPDTSINFLNMDLSMPLLAAPITGTVTNMGGAIDELDYNSAIVNGCINSGIIAFVGDGASPEKYKIGIQAIEKKGGIGIPVFKPRSDNKEIKKRIKAAENAGAIAVGIDIDAVVFKTMSLKNQPVGPKSFDEISDLISSTRLPFFLKGIMNPQDAELAVKAGAYAIVVSNHGGRVLDQMPGGADVMPEIVKSVNGKIKILLDGGIRSGVDLFKAIALGADAALMGRPLAFAAIAMEEKGVSFYIDHIKKELKKTMILTGCNKISNIDNSTIIPWRK